VLMAQYMIITGSADWVLLFWCTGFDKSENAHF